MAYTACLCFSFNAFPMHRVPQHPSHNDGGGVSMIRGGSLQTLVLSWPARVDTSPWSLSSLCSNFRIKLRSTDLLPTGSMERCLLVTARLVVWGKCTGRSFLDFPRPIRPPYKGMGSPTFLKLQQLFARHLRQCQQLKSASHSYHNTIGFTHLHQSHIH